MQLGSSAPTPSKRIVLSTLFRDNPRLASCVHSKAEFTKSGGPTLDVNPFLYRKVSSLKLPPPPPEPKSKRQKPDCPGGAQADSPHRLATMEWRSQESGASSSPSPSPSSPSSPSPSSSSQRRGPVGRIQLAHSGTSFWANKLMAVGAATRRSPTTDVGGELALSVTVYHPSSSLSEPMSRFLVLGRQPLTDLRDAIQCSSDRHGQALAKSGYFFIEGIFYNDMRCPGALDYSKNIIDWMHEQEGRQPLVARSMDGVRIDQLTIRLRCPYLYAHQGNCEHVLIFDSVRVVSGDMPRDAQDYPVVVFTTRPRHPGCYGCEKSPARWISYDDIHADRNPFMWCDHCFNHFHFNANGSASYQPLPHVEDLSTVPE